LLLEHKFISNTQVAKSNDDEATSLNKLLQKSNSHAHSETIKMEDQKVMDDEILKIEVDE
jgi:hypothetical protein